MGLCGLCQSMPLENLPPFPAGDQSFLPDSNGIAHFFWYSYVQLPSPLGYPLHPNLASLRSAVDAGCQLCRQVETQVKDVRHEIEKRGATTAWEMFATDREDGRPGFSMLIKCTDQTGSTCSFLPVAAFSFAGNQDGPLRGHFRGRVIETFPSQATYSQVLGWLRKCDEHHDCRPQDSTLPTRLIDVGDAQAGNQITVVETKNKSTGSYIALSYCWGMGPKEHGTRTSTLIARMAGFDMSSLPKTHRDAIELCRVFGVRYLWIDSICICQDDVKDWERESARMAAVYANAYLTLSGAGSETASGGLLRPRRPRTYVLLTHTTDNDACGSIFACRVPLDRIDDECNGLKLLGEPISQRGWTFQERVLSRRVLHFSSEQVYFECLLETWSEEGFRSSCSTYKRLGLASGKDLRLDDWYGLVQTYGGRELTYPADKLPAMSGIAKVFRDQFQDEYMAGLWRSDIHRGLLWHTLNMFAKVATEYGAPSWSWASIDGPIYQVHDRFRGLNEDGDWEGGDWEDGDWKDGSWKDVANILDHCVQLVGDNPFGRVRAGWIMIKAPLVRIATREPTQPLPMFLDTPQVQDGFRVRALFDVGKPTVPSNETIHCLVISSHTKSCFSLEDSEATAANTGPSAKDTSRCYLGLLVVSVGDSANTFKRVGMAELHESYFGPGELDSWRTITLV